MLNETIIQNLLEAGGMIQGVGDWRPEKGGNYGQFRIVDPEDPLFKQITATGGRQAQLAAMQKPIPYDIDTKDLLEWFFTEAEIRGRGVTRI